jgi:sulfate permease, SulP family
MFPPVFAPADPLAQRVPALRIVRLNGSIYFGAVNHVEESLQAIDGIDPDGRHLLLVGTGINFIDLAGAGMLAQEARRRRALGGGLYLFNMKEEALRMLEASGQLAVIGKENVFRLGDDVVSLLAARIANASLSEGLPSRKLRAITS